LVAIAKSDNKLKDYGIIIIDEAHQHSGDTDILLGLLKKLVLIRPELKVVVMSATMNTDQFKDFFPHSAVLEVPGRTYPVDIKYLPQPAYDMIDDLIKTILEVHLTERSGDILVFVPGKFVMNKVSSGLRTYMYGNESEGREPMFKPEQIGDLDIYSLHGGLSKADQDKAVLSIAPAPQLNNNSRKVIIATNIAETSVMLPGVTIVIDSLQHKSEIWNPENDSTCLTLFWVSQAVAAQRSGRAGRTRPGGCYRMCTSTGFSELAEHTVSSIQHGDMIQECLTILKMGYDPIDFPYMAAPATETVARALGILVTLQAVAYTTAGLRITNRGRALSSLPVNIWNALMVLNSPDHDCQDAVLSLVSMLEAVDSGGSVWIPCGSEQHQAALEHLQQSNGDHIMLLNIYLAWCEAGFARKKSEFLAQYSLNESVMKAADSTRILLIKYLLGTEGIKLNWAPGHHIKTTDPRYYVRVLEAIASANFLRVAKRDDRRPELWETIRSGELARLSRLGCNPATNRKWLV
jgi:pre-mRNA-splicing factor ATP-dependent RNA helicase DHX15/PRP43